jgi:hypothetical protein
MNISRDYKEMIEDKYINNKSVFTLEINKLQKELKESVSINEVCTMMDNLASYKKVIEMTIGFQNINTKKYPDNMYVSARGAISLGSNTRIWFHHYTGKANTVTEKMREEAELALRKKAIKELLK